jgi:type IV secretion system protein VirD4
MSLNSRQHLMNLNVLIIGGSGSGKTRFYAKPNIMCLNSSFVVTDPKGEIFQSVGKMLFEEGYELKVFNTIEMAYSNNYNPFHYVYDYEGQLSEDSVSKMIDVFMQNTKGEGEKDDFWSQSAMKAITAIVFLLFEESEYNAKFDENGKIDPATRDLAKLNFFSVTEKMRKLVYPPQGTEDGFFFVQEETEADEDFVIRREGAYLCELDKDFIELEKRKGETLATRLYKEIRNSPQETGQSIISTAGARTQMFNQKNLANLTCCDNIQLETLGDRKTALFIIISATNATYNFLAAMMYTQMFDVLANRANFKYGGVLPVHVRCIMDEFANSVTRS